MQGFRTEKSKVEPGFCPSHFCWILNVVELDLPQRR